VHILYKTAFFFQANRHNNFYMNPSVYVVVFSSMLDNGGGGGVKPVLFLINLQFVHLFLVFEACPELVSSVFPLYQKS
jgi:hypothetical protein